MFLLVFVGIMAVIVFGAGFMAGWTDFAAVWDFTSLAMVVLIGVSALAASGLWRDFLNAFHLTMRKRKSAGLLEWKRAEEAVELFIKAVRYGGFFITVLEFVNMYNIPDDPWAWRANLVVMSLVLLYAYGMSVLLLPVRSRLHVGMIEYMQDGDENEENGEDTNQGKMAEIRKGKEEETIKKEGR